MGVQSTAKGMLLSFLLGTRLATAQQENNTTHAKAFNVTFFQASGTPHSMYGLIIVNWTPGPNTPATECRAEPAGSPSLPTTGKTACYDNPNMSFSLERMSDGGAMLGLWYEPRSAPSRHGVHHINVDEIVVIPGLAPTGDVEAYYGPVSFMVETTQES